VVTQKICGGYKGDVVAQRLCVDTEEVWWIKRGCSGSKPCDTEDVVAKKGM
jgi:hypothetical protein